VSVAIMILLISCRSVLLAMMRYMACVGRTLIVVGVRRLWVTLMHRGDSKRDETNFLDSGLSESENLTEEQWES
jgi:hypothetical protein